MTFVTLFEARRGEGRMMLRVLLGVVASGTMFVFVWLVAASNSTAGWAAISFAFTAAVIGGWLYLWTRPISRLQAALQSSSVEKFIAVARPSLDFYAGLRRLGASGSEQGRSSGGFVLLVVGNGILDVVGANGRLLARLTDDPPLTIAVAKPTELDGTTYGTLGVRVLVRKGEVLIPLDFAICNPRWPVLLLKELRDLDQVVVRMNRRFTDR